VSVAEGGREGHTATTLANRQGDTTMRFIMMHKSDAAAEAGVPPTPELIAAMGKFTEEVTKAGVLLQAEGLLPSSMGARVTFDSGKRTVIDGPYAEAKEVYGGFVRPGRGDPPRRRPERGAALASYPLLPSVRGDLLTQLGRFEEARAEFLRAASLTRNAREHTLFMARADASVHSGGSEVSK
jgi:hypothetical protein